MTKKAVAFVYKVTMAIGLSVVATTFLYPQFKKLKLANIESVQAIYKAFYIERTSLLNAGIESDAMLSLDHQHHINVRHSSLINLEFAGQASAIKRQVDADCAYLRLLHFLASEIHSMNNGNDLAEFNNVLHNDVTDFDTSTLSPIARWFAENPVGAALAINGGDNMYSSALNANLPSEARYEWFLDYEAKYRQYINDYLLDDNHYKHNKFKRPDMNLLNKEWSN